ncbi:MAG: efflux RND transporter periplasmic adaptor subunit [Chitinophagales bacterium]
MKKNLKIATSIIVVLLAAFFGFRFFSSKGETQIMLTTVKAEKGQIANEVTATGTVEPVDQVEVGTQVSGKVDKIYVDYNSVVKKGQLLAELDKTALNSSVENAQASYNAAQSQMLYQQQNYNRQKSMYDAGVISKADFESAEYSYKIAKTNLSQSATSLQNAKSNLGYALIYSPIDGVVLTKDVDEGQTVAASYSTPTLFTIAKDITKMKVEANVDEADIGNVKEGQRVSFTVDAYPDGEFAGKVTQVRLGATTTSNVVTYTVVVEVDNADQKLKPGLTATITIYTKELNDILIVPAQALKFSPDITMLTSYYEKNKITEAIPQVVKSNAQNTVWVKKQNGAIERKVVEIGDKDGVNTQIISGLNVGENVVTALTETQQSSISSDTNSTSSPFMPKPPTRNSKKSTATSKN